jgi:hypothetical protein
MERASRHEPKAKLGIFLAELLVSENLMRRFCTHTFHGDRHRSEACADEKQASDYKLHISGKEGQMHGHHPPGPQQGLLEP